MRILRCLDCLTLEELPDAPPRVDPHNIQPGEDPLLDELVSRHAFPNGERHQGQLFAVEDAHWQDETVRQTILEQMGIKTTGLPGEFYEVRSTLHEDALKCFEQHGRPDRCVDWKDDRKRLGRPTREGEAWSRQNYKAPQVYLCNFCPVASQVMVAQREARGDYDQ